MTTTEFFTKLIKQLPVDIQNGPWIVGGFPLSVYRNDNIFTHDIDYFFKDYDQYLEYVNKFKTKFAEVKPELKEGDDVFDIVIYDIPFSYIETDNSYTFTPNTDDGIQVQFIKKRFYNDLSEIFDDFDITACKIATDGVDFYASDDTYHHIDNNILHIEKFHDKSIKRFTKYVQYGFAPTKETVQGIYGIANPVFNFAGICDY